MNYDVMSKWTLTQKSTELTVLGHRGLCLMLEQVLLLSSVRPAYSRDGELHLLVFVLAQEVLGLGPVWWPAVFVHSGEGWGAVDCVEVLVESWLQDYFSINTGLFAFSFLLTGNIKCCLAAEFSSVVRARYEREVRTFFRFL